MGADQPPQEEQPRAKSNGGPPKDDQFDERYDVYETITVNPVKARQGFVLTVTLPNGRTHLQNIPAGTRNGYLFCVKGVSPTPRPDNYYGNFWVELAVPQFGEAQNPKQADGREDI